MPKKILRVVFIVLLFLPLITAAHFLIFPRETRCILIDLADFKKQKNIYYRNGDAPADIHQLSNLKIEAEKKVASFWKITSSINYKIIYCSNEADYNKYGLTGAPAVTYRKLGAYIVLPGKMFDANILAHEISHTVLYRSIGWYNLQFKIPTWFDEGLSMQVDDRDYYSMDTLLKKKSSGLILPDIMLLDTPKKFYTGNADQIMLNFLTAKYVVHEWLQKNSLNAFIESINNGHSFEESYNQ